MTRVPNKATWEYCLFVGDNEFGYYKKDGSKVSKPFGMLAEKTFGDSGSIKIRLAKSLFNNSSILRYTVTSFNPGVSNSDPLWQGGSSAADVFPGTPATFGGEINGYGEISGNGILSVTTYTIYYIYDGINPIIEYSSTGSILNRYIYAGGMHIARIAGADTNWYHSDALGSPQVMTNETPDGVWSATYYPFGEATTSGTRTNTHQFTGKEMDSEMGLNYFCQRYYDPEIGRFMSLDPQDSPASSPYAYCANNPLKFTDPTGEKFSYMEQDERNWAMRDRAIWKQGMENCYTGRAAEHWFLGNSAELDPEFWAKGWDWTCSDPNIRAAVFVLSSGIFEFDIFTESGWLSINIGEWIKQNDVQFNTLALIGSRKYGSVSTVDAINKIKTNMVELLRKSELNPSKSVYNIYDIAAVVTHETVHNILKNFGMRGQKYDNLHELIAYGTSLYLLGNLMSPLYREHAQNYYDHYRWLVNGKK